MHTEYIDYSEGKTALEGYLAYDTTIKGKRPAVIVSHAWGGQDDFARGKAEALAKLGYAGFALDLYGKGVRGDSPEANTKLMQPFMSDRKLIDRRIKAALEAIRKHLIVDGDHIGAIGFCFGGLCALDLARNGATGLRGVVSFHGILAPPQPSAPETSSPRGKQITAKVLALHGYNDPFAPPDAVLAFAKEMTEARADWQMHMYGNTVHAFAVPEANMDDRGIVYNKSADQRSWIAMKNFFEEIFG